MAKSKQRDLMDANPKTGGGDKLPKLEEMFDLVKLNKDYTSLRLFGAFASYAIFWIPITGSKSGKATRIPRICLDYNPETDSFDDNGCPYRKAGLKPQVKYLFNAIDRETQEDRGAKKEPKYSKEEIKAGFLLPNTKSKSPIKVIQLPPGQVDKLKKFSSANKVKKEKYSVTHEEFGLDLNISFDADAKGNQYDIQMSERTPLTKYEQKLLLWNLSEINKAYAPMSLEDAKADFKKLRDVMDGEEGGYGDDDSKSKKSKKKKSKKDESDISDDSDNSDDSDISDSSDDSDNDKKKSKKKDKKSSKSKKSNKSDSSDDSDASGSDNSDSSASSDLSNDSDASDDSDVKSKSKKSKKSKKDESDMSDNSDDSSSDDSDADSDSSDESGSDSSDDSGSDNSGASDESDEKSKKSKKKDSKKSSKDKKKKRK
jgi:hypothetical protein